MRKRKKKGGEEKKTCKCWGETQNENRKAVYRCCEYAYWNILKCFPNLFLKPIKFMFKKCVKK